MFYRLISKKQGKIARETLTLLIFILLSQNGISQSVFAGFGPNYTLTTQKVAMVGGANYFDNTDYSVKLSYEHEIIEKKWAISISYTKFKGYTFIGFDEGSVIGNDGFPTLAIGYTGVNNNRFDLGFKYHLLLYKRFYLNAVISSCIQFSTPDGSEFYDIEPPNGPDYVQIGQLPTSTNQIAQLVPALGLDIGLNCWNRVDFRLSFQGVYAFKSFQEMYFTYSYKGMPKETAIFETTGTGIFTTLSIGYRFKKVSKK